MQHQELVRVLKKIPNLYLEFVLIEKSFKRSSDLKRKLSKEAYQSHIIQHDSKLKHGRKLLQRIRYISNELEISKPDFRSSFHHGTEVLYSYVNTIGYEKLSPRMKKQLELTQLLEIKHQFQNIHDFFDEDKINKLKKFLKGKH